MSRFLHPLVLIAVVLLSTNLHAAGQLRAGTAAGTELLIPVGARDIALGGSSIATTSGLSALHWNPAGLARASSRSNGLFSTMSYLADIRVNYIAASTRLFSAGSVGLHVKTLDFGQIPVTTETSPDGTGATFSPTFLTLGLTYAQTLTDRITLGATGHYIVNRIERASATGLSFSAGLQYANLADIPGLDLGVTLKHIGTRMQFDGPALLRSGQLDGLRRPNAVYKVEASSADLPSTFEIGLGYRRAHVGPGQVRLTSLFRHDNFAADQWKLGSEYIYNEFFSIRGGFDYAAAATSDYLFGTSFGFGLQLNVGSFEDVKLDYAYTTVDHFDALNTFTFQVGF